MAASEVQQFNTWLDQQTTSQGRQPALVSYDYGNPAQIKQQFANLSTLQQQFILWGLANGGWGMSEVTGTIKGYLTANAGKDPSTAAGAALPYGADMTGIPAKFKPAASKQDATAAAAQAGTAQVAAAAQGGSTTAAQPVTTGTPQITVDAQGNLTGAAAALAETGTGFNYLGATTSDPQSVAAMVGIDFTTADQQYQQYVANYNQAAARVQAQGPAGGVLGQGLQPAGAATWAQQPTPPITEAQYIQAMAQATYGLWMPAIDMLAYTWQQDTGTPMPQALAQQVFTSLATLQKQDPNAALQVQTYMLSSIEALQGQMGSGQQITTKNLTLAIQPFLTELATYAPSVWNSTSGQVTGNSSESLIGQYLTANPLIGPTQAAETGQLRTSAINLLTEYGITPTADAVNQIASGANLNQLQGLVSELQSAGYSTSFVQQMLQSAITNGSYGDPNGASGIQGMTWGQLTIALGSMSQQQWSQYFGAPPTAQQLQSMAGWTPDEIHAYIMDSPSKVPGVTNQQYADYTSLLMNPSNQSTHTFSAGIDDSLIQSLHQAVGTAPKAGPPQPEASFGVAAGTPAYAGGA
jgi:hypothetical protein